MGLSAHVQGWPEAGAATEADLQVLAEAIAPLLDDLYWGAGALSLPPEADGDGSVTAFVDVAGGDDEKMIEDIWQCVGLALAMSRRRPGWTWRVADELGAVDTDLGAALWLRGGRAVRLPPGTEDPRGVPAEADPALDEKLGACLDSLAPYLLAEALR